MCVLGRVGQCVLRGIIGEVAVGCRGAPGLLGDFFFIFFVFLESTLL